MNLSGISCSRLLNHTFFRHIIIMLFLLKTLLTQSSTCPSLTSETNSSTAASPISCTDLFFVSTIFSGSIFCFLSLLSSRSPGFSHCVTYLKRNGVLGITANHLSRLNSRNMQYAAYTIATASGVRTIAIIHNKINAPVFLGVLSLLTSAISGRRGVSCSSSA